MCTPSIQPGRHGINAYSLARPYQTNTLSAGDNGFLQAVFVSVWWPPYVRVKACQEIIKNRDCNNVRWEKMRFSGLPSVRNCLCRIIVITCQGRIRFCQPGTGRNMRQQTQEMSDKVIHGEDGFLFPSFSEWLQLHFFTDRANEWMRWLGGGIEYV